MKKVIIDTDVGYDDIVAILMLFHSRKYDICGISTVTGVSNVAVGSRNISRLLHACGYEVPIYVGAEKAIKEAKNLFPKLDIERADKLDLLKETIVDTANIAKLKKREDLIVFLKTSDEPFTFICLGPLTNIAYLIQNEPELFFSKVSDLIIMGGVVEAVGVESGLAPPHRQAEYNSALDPEAAKIVMESRIQKTLIPIDVTYQVPACIELTDISKPVGKLLKKLLETSQSISTQAPLLRRIVAEIISNNNRDFDCFYDLVVAATCIEPVMIEEILKTSFTVSLDGETRGRTLLVDDTNPTTQVIMKINQTRFYDQLTKIVNEY